jgi:hypothetical protein
VQSLYSMLTGNLTSLKTLSPNPNTNYLAGYVSRTTASGPRPAVNGVTFSAMQSEA